MDDTARTSHHAAMQVGDFSTAHLYAGQGVAALTHERSAQEVVDEFARAHY